MNRKRRLTRLNLRQSVLTGVGFLFLALAGILGMRAVRNPSVSSEVSAQASGDESQALAEGNRNAKLSGSLSKAGVGQKSVGDEAVAKSAVPAVAGAMISTEASAYTRQLVMGLTNIDMNHGAMTEEQATKWKGTLQTLTLQGASAVPAIREFLGKNWELDFSGSAAGNLLGERSLRGAMIDALSQIGGPQATDALLETLRGATLPAEIVQLAQALEQQAPGQYHEQAINAVGEVVNMATSGQLPTGWDVGPLFKLLQSYGEPSTAVALEKFQSPFNYYATMALAGLAGGEGVQALVRETKSPTDPGLRDFAAQMLAQAAVQYPDTSGALMEQVKTQQIPASAWPRIAAALAGEEYQIGQPSAQSADVGATPGLKTYHIAFANENFYSVPLMAASMPAEQLQQRLALIDQLLAATPDQAAQAALRAARASLTQLATN